MESTMYDSGGLPIMPTVILWLPFKNSSTRNGLVIAEGVAYFCNGIDEFFNGIGHAALRNAEAGIRRN